MKRILHIVVLLLLMETVQASNLVLVQFASNDFQTAQAYLAELEQKGVTVRHVFAPNSAIVDAHGLSSDLMEDDENRWSIVTETDLSGSKAETVDERILGAYRHLTNPPPAEKDAGGGGLQQLSYRSR